VQSTMCIISWLDIIINLPMVWIFQKVNLSTHISITWLLECQDNFMMVWLIMMMEHQHQLHKWHMMSATSLLICKDVLALKSQISKLDITCWSPEFFCLCQSNTGKLEQHIETCCQWDMKCTLLEMVFIITILRREWEIQEQHNSEEECGHENLLFYHHYILIILVHVVLP